MLSHGYRVLEVPATMHARGAGASKKGSTWLYGRRYAGVVLGTWWREGCPSPVTDVAPPCAVHVRPTACVHARWRGSSGCAGTGGSWRRSCVGIVIRGSWSWSRSGRRFIYSDARDLPRARDDHLEPFPDRVVGYGAFLGPALLTTDTWAIAGVQHLLGLLTAVLGYALLRRWGVSGRIATLAMLPVLFDAMQLLLEHSILTDVLFDLVLLAGIAALAWRRTPHGRRAPRWADSSSGWPCWSGSVPSPSCSPPSSSACWRPPTWRIPGA